MTGANAWAARRAGGWGPVCLLAAIVVASCGDGATFDGVSWQSSRVRYQARQGDPGACSDAVVSMEMLSDRFATILGRSASSWEPFDYYKFLDDADYARVRASAGLCGHLPTIACTQRGTIYSPHPVDYHELAHVYYDGILSAGPRFLTEGFAIALTCMSSRGPYFAPDLPLEAALNPDGPDGPRPAARLTAAVWFAGTPQQFYELQAGLGPGVPGRDVVSAAVTRVYGLDIETLWIEARSKRGLECVAYPSCATAPPLKLDETIALAETCTGIRAVRLSDAVAPAVAIRVAGTPLVVAACDGSAAPDPVRRLEIRPPQPAPWRFEHWIRSPAVEHVLFPSPSELRSGADAVVEARAIGAAFSETCIAGAVPSQVFPDRAIRIVLPYEAGTFYFPMRFAAPMPLAISLLGWGGSNPRRVRWCQGCPTDPAADCADLDAAAGATIQASGDVVLVVEGPSETDDLLILELVPEAAAVAQR